MCSIECIGRVHARGSGWAQPARPQPQRVGEGQPLDRWGWPHRKRPVGLEKLPWCLSQTDVCWSCFLGADRVAPEQKVLLAERDLEPDVNGSPGMEIMWNLNK